MPIRNRHFDSYSDSGSSGQDDRLNELHFCNFPRHCTPGIAISPHFTLDRDFIRIKYQNSKTPDQSPATTTGMVIGITPVFSFRERRNVGLFEKVKATVPARLAAEHYGLNVNRAGMACCPFHDDKSPSMKLDDRYYCFGCGATGDAVDLTAQLFSLSAKEAALKLAYDFGIEVSTKRPITHQKAVKTPVKSREKDEAEVWTDRAIRKLTDYLWLLRDWKERYAPGRMDDEDWHPLFVEACHRKDYVEYLLDELLVAGRGDYPELKKSMEKEVERIEMRLERYAGRDASEDRSDPGRS